MIMMTKEAVENAKKTIEEKAMEWAKAIVEYAEDAETDSAYDFYINMKTGDIYRNWGFGNTI